MNKINKHFLIVILSVALSFMLSACGSEEAALEEEIEIEEEIGVFSDEEIAAAESGETEEETVSTISAEDAKALVDEKLSEGMNSEEYGSTALGDDTFYIFSVNKDGKTLSQLLAVNDVTGEVFVYDELNSEYLPFSDFEYYEAAKDSNTDWSGQYAGEKFELLIEATDPGNFEYRIMKGSKEKFLGFAYFNDYVNAQSQTEEYGNLELNLEGDKITIIADKDCEFAGTYTKQ